MGRSVGGGVVAGGAHALARAGVVVDGRHSSGRNGRAKRDGGGRTEGVVLSQEVYGDDDVCVVEIAMQVCAGMQAGRRAGERQRVTG